MFVEPLEYQLVFGEAGGHVLLKRWTEPKNENVVPNLGCEVEVFNVKPLR